MSTASRTEGKALLHKGEILIKKEKGNHRKPFSIPKRSIYTVHKGDFVVPEYAVRILSKTPHIREMGEDDALRGKERLSLEHLAVVHAKN